MMRNNLAAANRELQGEVGADRMVTQSFSAAERALVMAFLFEGGPRESETFIVEFTGVILFHLPFVKHGSVFFRLATEDERERLIPSCSYDRDEVSGERNACSVVELVGETNTALGFYVAARDVSSSWNPRDAVTP